MPEFTTEMWQSFKQQFLSVIDWLLYSFDLLYDSFRSRPMLYLFVFFPIFALVFFCVFNLLTHLVPLKSLFENSDLKNDNSMLKTPSGRGSRNTAKGINLASAQKQQSRAAVQSVRAVTAKANPFNSPGASHAQAHGSGRFNRAGSPGAFGFPGSVRAVVAGGSSSGSAHGSVSSGGSTSYGNGLAKAAAKGVDNAVAVTKDTAKDKIKNYKKQKESFDNFVSENGGVYYKPPDDEPDDEIDSDESIFSDDSSNPLKGMTTDEKISYLLAHQTSTDPLSAVSALKSTKPHPELDIEYDEDD